MTSPVRAPRPTPRRLPEVAAPRRAHLRVVPPSSKPTIRRRRTGAVLTVAMVMVFGTLMASAILHGLLVSGQDKLNRLDTELEQTKTDLAREKLTLAHLQSPARIAKAAKKMGMVPATDQHWLSPGTGAPPVVTGSTATTTPTPTTTPTSPDASTSADELATSTGGGAAQ